MPSLRVKDFIKHLVKDFDLGKVFAVRSRRPTKNGCTQRSSTTAHREGDDSISVDITNDFRFASALHSNSSPREPGPGISTNASSTRCTWGESSVRKVSDMIQTFLPFVQAVAGPIPL
ncbi:hypothetical protein F4604DRAFT_1926164 [Suillus subluteus]|nr:hypothetical protein F4604DRAFT_1926164 [Suillus subluteus]